MAQMPKFDMARAKGKARVLIVDDQPVVRDRVAEVIRNEPDLVVCGDADNGKDAFKICETCKPDLIITGLCLKESHGLDLIKDLHARSPAAKVLVFSMYDESLYAERAIRAGASGFVSKHEKMQELLCAIRRVLSGRIYLSERVSSYALDQFFARPSLTATNGLLQLSDREIEVFELIGHGRTIRQIATALHLDIKTVQTYQARLKTKLNAKTSNELARRAQQSLQHSIIKPRD
jgi:DNA-binding NarL/FixJ family response regulator